MNTPDNPLDCSRWVDSPKRTVAESFLAIFLVVSYLPQYIRIASRGTFGISSWWILSTALWSTTQLATRFTNPQAKYAFNCVNNGEIRGFKAYSALLGFIQVLTQWICAMVLVIVYLNYRNDSPPLTSGYDWPPPSEGITAKPISSTKLKVVIGTFTFLMLLTALAILWRPDYVEDNFGLDILLTALAEFFHYVFVIASIPLVLLQYVPQIITILSLGTRGSISIISLALQIPVFSAVGVAQFLRVGIPTFGSPPHRRGPVLSYFDYSHMSLNFIIAAVGQVALMIVCLIVDWGHLQSGDGIGSVKLGRTGEELPLLS